MKKKEIRLPEININNTGEIDSIMGTKDQITLINTLMSVCEGTGKSVVVSCFAKNYEKKGENLILIGEPYPNGKWRLWYSKSATKKPSVDGIICDCETKSDLLKCMRIMKGRKDPDAIKDKRDFDLAYAKARKFVDLQK